MALTDGEQRWLERIEDKLDSFRKEMGEMCIAQAKQDQRVAVLERVGKWMAGVMGAILTGVGLHYTVGKP